MAGSLLVSMPTWQFFDPLPVLTRPPVPVRRAAGEADPSTPELQNEEASAAEVLGRDSTATARDTSDHDDGVDTPGAHAGKAGRR